MEDLSADHSTWLCELQPELYHVDVGQVLCVYVEGHLQHHGNPGAGLDLERSGGQNVERLGGQAGTPS